MIAIKSTIFKTQVKRQYAVMDGVMDYFVEIRWNEDGTYSGPGGMRVSRWFYSLEEAERAKAAYEAYKKLYF